MRQVVLREFGSSLRQKEEEEEEIDRRLLQIQKYLHLVRYAAVTNYYSGSLIKVPIDDVMSDDVLLLRNSF